MRAPKIIGAAALLAASIAGAQTPAPKIDSGCVTSPDGGIECRKVVRGDGSGMYRLERNRMDSAMMKRAILGLELRPTGTKRDTLGVFVEGVIPKGPAENAGIFEGDRIASINGVDLRVTGADVDDPYTNGLAAHKLRREVQKLTPGSRVTLRVYSGGRIRDVPVTAGRASDFPHDGAFSIRVGGPGMFQFNGPGGMRIEGPEGMGIDPEHLRMMIEQGMKHGDGHEMDMRPPVGAMKMRTPMVHMRGPMMPTAPGRLIRI